MSALSFDFNLDLESALLAEVHDVREVAGGICWLAASLVDGVGRGYLFRVVFGKPADAVSAAVLLVGGERQQEVFLQLHGVAEEDTAGHHLSSKESFAVG